MNTVWAHLVGWIVQGAQLMVRAAAALVAAVASLARVAGLMVAGQVAILMTATRWIAAQVHALVDVLMRMAAGATFPVIAWVCADAWNDAPVAQLRERQRTDPSTSSVRDRWQGVAADRYYDVAVEQADAVDRALTGAQIVRDQLRDCAVATGALYCALCAGAFEFLGILCAAAAATATGIASAEGIACAIGALADFGALVVAIAGGICAYGFVTARIPDALADCFAGDWPSPHSSTFADGSLSDGDTTDWRLWM